MENVERFAIYYLPDHLGLAAFGARWLGWDVDEGTAVPHYDVPNLAEITERPGKYGFHGTLKPPFRLAEGASVEALHAHLAAFAARTAAFEVDGLRVAQLGRFLALVPDGPAPELARFAFACVTEFDRYRRRADAAEIARRREAGLTADQDKLLLKWGYPFVGPEFRFHLTLSGKLAPDKLEQTARAAVAALPDLPRPFPFTSVALAGERADGKFQTISRYKLKG